MIRKLLIGLMLLVGAPSLTLAASFDCDKAATDVEFCEELTHFSEPP